MAATRKLLTDQMLHRVEVYRKERKTDDHGEPVQELCHVCTVGGSATPVDIREYDDGIQVKTGVRWEIKIWRAAPLLDMTSDWAVRLDGRHWIELEAVVPEGLTWRLIGVER